MIFFFLVNKKAYLGQLVKIISSKYSSSKTISLQLIRQQQKCLLFVISNEIFIYCTKTKLICLLNKIIRKKIFPFINIIEVNNYFHVKNIY